MFFGGIIPFIARHLLPTVSHYPVMFFRLSKRNFSSCHVIPIQQEEVSYVVVNGLLLQPGEEEKSLQFSITKVDIQFSAEAVEVDQIEHHLIKCVF